ncbi:MAG: hypothetical protein OES53_07140 [Xanthomonadales bacterium]|jgi:cell division protein YceG involved in septum cleavage|nr:hypothetical protein [Xanthomonadales bacterium]MDH3923604.1 hypothetical protein [Xanthomonadales bacterium]MDH3939353.1 hypothetical protein [Xanthomonadales bacterium]MDH4001218.1 hypothetical protein [Xanthomonadales bacterium]
MNKYLIHCVLIIALTLAAGSVSAQSLDEAAAQAAKQHNAKVLSAQTVQQGDKQVHVIKLLTKDGVVKTVRVTVRKR